MRISKNSKNFHFSFRFSSKKMNEFSIAICFFASFVVQINANMAGSEGFGTSNVEQKFAHEQVKRILQCRFCEFFCKNDFNAANLILQNIKTLNKMINKAELDGIPPAMHEAVGSGNIATPSLPLLESFGKKNSVRNWCRELICEKSKSPWDNSEPPSYLLLRDRPDTGRLLSDSNVHNVWPR